MTRASQVRLRTEGGRHICPKCSSIFPWGTIRRTWTKKQVPLNMQEQRKNPNNLALVSPMKATLVTKACVAQLRAGGHAEILRDLMEPTRSPQLRDVWAEQRWRLGFSAAPAPWTEEALWDRLSGITVLGKALAVCLSATERPLLPQVESETVGFNWKVPCKSLINPGDALEPFPSKCQRGQASCF